MSGWLSLDAEGRPSFVLVRSCGSRGRFGMLSRCHGQYAFLAQEPRKHGTRRGLVVHFTINNQVFGCHAFAAPVQNLMAGEITAKACKPRRVRSTRRGL